MTKKEHKKEEAESALVCNRLLIQDVMNMINKGVKDNK
jgi:hypothetical protein